MNREYPEVPLRTVLRKVEEPVAIAPDESYKQVTVRLFHKGVVLRGQQPGAEIRTARQWRVRAGQILLSRIDARNGAIGLVPSDIDGAVVTNDFWAFEADKGLAEPRFLDAYFGTSEFVEACKRASEGTTNRVRLQLERFLNIEVPLPPLTEQRRIVARIEELAARIDDAHRVRNEGLEEANRIFRSILRQCYHEMHHGNGGIQLADLVTVIGGGTPTKSNPFFWQGDIPWVSPKDMKVFRLADAVDHISDAAIEESAAKLIEPGAVLVVIRGMILSHSFPVAVTKARVAINQDMKALVPRDDIDSEYLAYMLRGAESDMLGRVERSSHDTRRLGTADLLSVSIPMPKDRTAQKGVVTYLDGLQGRVDAVQRLQAETAAELDALLPSILDKAFKGEL